MKKKTVLRLMILALIIIWMLIVFRFSNQNGEASSSLSREIASHIVPEEKVDIVEPYIRKIAHLSEYAAGGMLFLALFFTYPITDHRRMLASVLMGIEYASFDEIHQLFIAGRAGKITDVLIDTIGVCLGVCILMLIYKVIIKIFHKRKEAF